ncbi:type IV pilin protein [Pseudomonas tohonis]|nr:type IV pilin protein [Pseudomonas tohonis]
MNKQNGFTLIELMIVVAVIAVLSAIAYPSYQSYVRRTACEDAKGALVGLSSAMERYRAQRGTYVGAASGTTPTIYPSQSPIDGSTKQFNLSITAVSATGYTIQASAITGRLWSGASNTLTISSNGARSGGGSLSTAWARCPSN